MSLLSMSKHWLVNTSGWGTWGGSSRCPPVCPWWRCSQNILYSPHFIDQNVAIHSKKSLKCIIKQDFLNGCFWRNLESLSDTFQADIYFFLFYCNKLFGLSTRSNKYVSFKQINKKMYIYFCKFFGSSTLSNTVCSGAVLCGDYYFSELQCSAVCAKASPPSSKYEQFFFPGIG